MSRLSDSWLYQSVSSSVSWSGMFRQVKEPRQAKRVRRSGTRRKPCVPVRTGYDRLGWRKSIRRSEDRMLDIRSAGRIRVTLIWYVMRSVAHSRQLFLLFVLQRSVVEIDLPIGSGNFALVFYSFLNRRFFDLSADVPSER